MTILEELSPTLTAVGVIITALLAVFVYFKQLMDIQEKELKHINERLTRLELESEYRKELDGLRSDIDELNRKLSDTQKGNDA